MQSSRKSFRPQKAGASGAKQFFQPKLSVNTPGDKYEQEADTIAEQVVRMPLDSSMTRSHATGGRIQRKCENCDEEDKIQKKEGRQTHTYSTPALQRKCSACEEEEKHVQRKSSGHRDDAEAVAPESMSQELSSTRGHGNALDRSTLAFMNHAFATDFSHVQVHLGNQSAQLNNSIQAKAFTHGSDIYFNQGQYNPNSIDGKRLLAHELTHVVQQGGASSNIQRKLKAEPTYPPYLVNRLPGRNLSRDPASRLSASQRVGHVRGILANLCPAFQLDATTGVVSPTNPAQTEAEVAAGASPMACCCLHILTRGSSTNNWRILVSDVVSPHTLESEHVVVIPGPDAPIDYGHWTGNPGERRVLMTNEIILGHELCGHAGLMELSAHPLDTGRLTSAEHDPTVNIQNIIATEQGVPQSDLRGLAAGGTHRGESFARIVISGYPINRISPFSIPDRAQHEKLSLATRLVQTNDFFVDVVGHTDSSGGDTINDRVSQQRADVVKQFIAARVRRTRHLDRFDNSTPIANRFRSSTGVRDNQPPPPSLQGNPDNWRRVEIFLASFPAGTNNPPSNTPTTVNPVQSPAQASTLASTGDDCEKKLVTGAYPTASPVIAPKRMDNAHVPCNTCNPQVVRLSEEAESVVQRRVMGLSTIEDRLTRKLGDTVITDENVHDVLVLLDGLNATDFSDTLMAMEPLGYVETLFDQVGEDDKENFSNLLRRIQLNRIQTLADKSQIVDSCVPRKREKIQETLAETKVWARKCFVAVNGYIFDLEFGSTPDLNVADALDRHFFRQTRNGTLPEYRKIKYAQQIADNFRLLETQPKSYSNVCAQPYDPLCAAIAMAYVSHDDNTVNYCDSFFKNSKEERLRAVFHEYAHVHMGVEDTGYGSERVYQYLMPVDAINNASSYENFAVQILKTKGLVVSTAVDDIIDDCTDPQKEVIRKRMAFGARMVKDALNMIGAAGHPVSTAQNLRLFKTQVGSELKRVTERFKETDDAFAMAIKVECETSCDKDEIGYNRRPGTFVHVCPLYFTLSEDEQTNRLLLLIMERKGGGNIGSEPGTSAFANQDKDAAYDNLWTYVAYANAMSDAYPHWRFVKSEFRYEREIESQFEDLAAHLLTEITEEGDIRKTINSTYISVLRSAMNADLLSTVVNNASLSKSSTGDHIAHLTDLMKLAQMVSDGFLRFSGEAFLKQILVDEASAIAAKIITYRLEEKLKDTLITELYTQFQLIKANRPVDFPAVKANMDKIIKAHIDSLKLLDGYMPFLKEVRGIETSVTAHMEKLKGLLPASKHAQWEKAYYEIKVTFIGWDEDAIYNATTDQILAGKTYDKKARPDDPAAVIKKYKKELDDEYKIMKGTK